MKDPVAFFVPSPTIYNHLVVDNHVRAALSSASGETASMFDLFTAQRVLAVQPHYDDNDIAAGGTLRRLADAGAHIVYLTVTDDLLGVLDPEIDITTATVQLRAEQRAAGAIIGVAEQRWLDWPDAGGFDHVVLRDQIVEAIRATQPDLMITCDPWLRNEAHRDHVGTGLAALEAVLLSALPRHRALGEPHAPAAVGLCYANDPNAVIDTTHVQVERHAALDCYRSQFDDHALEALHEAIDRHESSQAPNGATHGEALRIVGTGTLHCAVRPASITDRVSVFGPTP
jgi:N,N'-diacetylchitobiose non-reducing end deacetylase